MNLFDAVVHETDVEGAQTEAKTTETETDMNEAEAHRNCSEADVNQAEIASLCSQRCANEVDIGLNGAEMMVGWGENSYVVDFDCFTIVIALLVFCFGVSCSVFVLNTIV